MRCRGACDVTELCEDHTELLPDALVEGNRESLPALLPKLAREALFLLPTEPFGVATEEPTNRSRPWGPNAPTVLIPTGVKSMPTSLQRATYFWFFLVSASTSWPLCRSQGIETA